MSKKNHNQDGVNPSLGDRVSYIAAGFCKGTDNNSPIARIVDMTNNNISEPRVLELNDKYRARGYRWTNAPGGIGTKVVLHDSAKMWGSAAFDLIARTSFNFVRLGGMPVYLTSLLNVRSLGSNINSDTSNAVLSLYEGMCNAAKACNMIVTNIKTSELSTVTSENKDAILKFNLSASAHGIYHQDRMILGNLKKGQIIMLMKENGFGSKGINSVRKAFLCKFGEKWYTCEEAIPYIKAAAEPSVLYDRFFCAINGWTDDAPNIKVHSLVNLSGGSFESELGHNILFPLGLSANLTNLCEPVEIMKNCADWEGMNCRSIYGTFNGGQGVAAIIDRDKEKLFCETAASFGLEAQYGGEIIKNSTPEVRIKSAFSGETIIFN